MLQAEKTKSERFVYLDYLRIFAVLAVIVTHVACGRWYAADVKGLEWNLLNVFIGATKWCVPVFLMISGTLFLQRDISEKKLYTKYILRLLIAYMFWSLVYATALPLYRYLRHSSSGFPVKQVVKDFLSSEYHMWYIPMLIGIYACIPLIKRIVSDRKTTIYFLLLSFVFSFVLPELVALIQRFLGGSVGSAAIIIYNNAIKKTRLQYLSAFAFYFILGYVLGQAELSKRQRIICYLLGLVGFAATIGLTAAASWKHGKDISSFIENNSINVMLEAVGMFVWFRYHFSRANQRRLLRELSECTFGVYLIHVLFLIVEDRLGVKSTMFNPALSVPAITLLTAAISFAVVFVIRRIPLLKKWIV